MSVGPSQARTGQGWRRYCLKLRSPRGHMRSTVQIFVKGMTWIKAKLEVAFDGASRSGEAPQQQPTKRYTGGWRALAVLTAGTNVFH
jgi:hypothetical protein